MNPECTDGMTPIRAPDLGLAMPGKLCGWRLEPGDELSRGETVAEIVAGGVLYDIAATVAGRLAVVDREVNAVVSPGDVIGWIEPTAAAGQNG